MCSLSNQEDTKKMIQKIDKNKINILTTLNASPINLKQIIVNKCQIIFQYFRHYYCKIIGNFFTIWFKLMWLASIVNRNIKICLFKKKVILHIFHHLRSMGRTYTCHAKHWLTSTSQ